MQHATSVVQVGYLGDAFCAKCLLDIPNHGEVDSHGSLLGYHRDRGDGGNSQKPSPFGTFSVGSERVLSMQLRTWRPDAQPIPGTECSFRLTAGSGFLLQSSDEERLGRDVCGTVVEGAWFHGMQTELKGACASVGYVVREVNVVKEVCMHTDVCLLSRADVAHLNGSPSKAFGLSRSEWPPFDHSVRKKPSRAAFLDQARDVWVAQADTYADKVTPLLMVALSKWV